MTKTSEVSTLPVLYQQYSIPPVFESVHCPYRSFVSSSKSPDILLGLPLLEDTISNGKPEIYSPGFNCLHYHLSKYISPTTAANSTAQGGGISMSVAHDPHNLRNPVNFADTVSMGFGMSAPGIKQSNSIGSSNTIGNGKAFGSSVGGANRRGVFGGGDANTRVASPHGQGKAITNNMAWQDSTGNAMGHGSAIG
ncbi:hypothetical protein RvY_01715 [Ramazzottius varieornatus]|uniref:Uncharacterized protein n=1 Tax=Ramazzottius varieornatus TaxID=947166 RepID=A0A1D1UPC5_RAMVA|nr:hypothetical protein RvY_01715 [Ramazzottius varieornatus]